MTYDFDDGKGRAGGSRIRKGASAFGLPLSLDEVITELDPPRRKVWRTVGEPRLLVIGSYEMGFDLSPEAGDTALPVWIDYAPAAGLLGWGSGAYARWCVKQMVADAVARFGASRQASFLGQSRPARTI